MSDTLHKLAVAHGFGSQVSLLRRYVLPCIGFTLESRQDCAVGSSRLGGGPDLPVSFDWPVNNESVWPAQTLPGYGSRAGDRMFADLKADVGSEPDFDAVGELSRALFQALAPMPDGPCHHLGGHSNNVQGDMQLEAQLVMNGLYCGNASGYNDPRAGELERTCEHWSLLLQLDSDDDAGFMWGDCGMLYYWARSADNARRDFTRVWMTLQCY